MADKMQFTCESQANYCNCINVIIHEEGNAHFGCHIELLLFLSFDDFTPSFLYDFISALYSQSANTRN